MIVFRSPFPLTQYLRLANLSYLVLVYLCHAASSVLVQTVQSEFTPHSFVLGNKSAYLKAQAARDQSQHCLEALCNTLTGIACSPPSPAC